MSNISAEEMLAAKVLQQQQHIGRLIDENAMLRERLDEMQRTLDAVSAEADRLESRNFELTYGFKRGELK